MAKFLKLKKIISFLVVSFILTSSFLAPFEFSPKKDSFSLEKINLVASAQMGDVPSQDYKGVVCGSGLSLLPGSKGNLGGCAAWIGYGVFVVSSIIMTVSGRIFNGALAYSMSNEAMNQPFIKKAWGETRNMANMLFILLLVVISISIILDLGKYKSKELVAGVIVIALLINFSLFISRVVIDAGNIVALGFYSTLTDVPDSKASNVIVKTSLKEKNVSSQFVEAFNPSNLISPKLFEAWSSQFGSKPGESSFVANVVLAMVFFISAAILIYASYIFLSAGFLFVIRVAWLWVLMALAPLAFISYIIPQLKAKGWDVWWEKLISKSFCIVVFMFWMWLTLLIVNDGFLKGVFSAPATGVADFSSFLITVLMQFMIVAVLLQMSLSSTKKLCEDGGIGKKVMGMAKGAAMLGVGAATGGTALLARQGLGKLAAGRIASLEANGAGTTMRGKMELKALKSVESAKFGQKESYKGRKERIAKEEEKYIRDIPTYAKKNEKGKVVMKDGKPVMHTKQEVADQYIKNRGVETKGEDGKTRVKTSLMSLVMGRAAGIEKGIKDYRGREEAKQGLGGLRSEVAVAKMQLDKAKKEAEKEEKYSDLLKDKDGNPLKVPKDDDEKKKDLEEYQKAFREHEEKKQETSEKQEKAKYTAPKNESKNESKKDKNKK